MIDLLELRDYMNAQSRTIEDLLTKVVTLNRELANARRAAGQAPPPKVSPTGTHRARAMAKARELGIDFHFVTERGPTGTLYRDSASIEQRGRLILALREPNAFPTGPMSYPEIGEALGMAHSGVRGAEKLAASIRAKGPYGWQRMSEAAA